MTTPPPPPPPGPSQWPSSQPATTASTTPATDRQPWWTGGRIVVAIVLVLLLMGGAGFVGFLVGVAVGSADSFIDEFDVGTTVDAEDFDDVPGATPLDAEAAEGSALQLGGRVNGVVGDRPVDHELVVPTGSEVDLEITDANFDTVLVVLDDAGQVVASDDDSGEDRLSLVSTSLDPGTYTVRVQSWSGADNGGYTLVAR